MLIAVAGSQGCGKAQPVSEPVLTSHGWKQIGSLEVGEKVITPAGLTAAVKGVFPQGSKSIYQVTFEDDSSTLCCEEHLWKCFYRKQVYVSKHNKWDILDNRRTTSLLVEEVISTKQIIDIMNNKYYNKVYIPVINQNIDLNFCLSVLPLPPYLLGVLLGDGNLGDKGKSTVITSADEELIQNVSLLLEQGYTLKHRGQYDYTISRGSVGSGHPSFYTETLRSLGLNGKNSDEKFIPDMYLSTTASNRYKLLCGLMDTDGTVSKDGHISFTTTSKKLAEQVRYLVWSLGGRAKIGERLPFYTNTDGDKTPGKKAYDIRITHPTPRNLFSLSRKQSRCGDGYYNGHKNNNVFLKREIKDIKLVGVQEAVCISVDSSEQLYITRDFVVTHNTTILNDLKDLGYPSIERKTSRSIQQEWGYTLEQINADHNLTQRFQQEILIRKRKDEIAAVQSADVVWFTERTYADMFTYALITLGQEDKYSDFLNDYYIACMEHQQDYSIVFYVKTGHFPVTSDPNRAAANPHYTRLVDLVMFDITKQMTPPDKLIAVETPHRDVRAQTISTLATGILKSQRWQNKQIALSLWDTPVQ